MRPFNKIDDEFEILVTTDDEHLELLEEERIFPDKDLVRITVF